MIKWTEYRFSDFVAINPSVTLPRDQPVSFVEMKDLEDGNRFCEATQERIITGGSRFQDGDTLFARITPCLENGKICQVKNLKNGVGAGSTEFYVFRGKDKISDTNFVYYLSRWSDVRDHAEINLDGTSGRQRVPRQAFDDLILSLPDLATQKAITEVLSSLDEKITLLQAQNLTLEKLADVFFRKWFIEDVNPDWEIKPLSSVADFLNGLSCQRFPPLIELDRLPVLKIKELSTGITENSDWARSTVKPEYIVRNGDVIFAWSASLMLKIWDGEDCVLNQHLFKVTSAQYAKWYYYLWCKHHLADFIAKAASHATTMGHIKRGDLDAAMVIVPTTDEMDNMSLTMSPLIDKLITNNKQIQTLTAMRDGLLPQLIGGELKVSNTK